MTLAIGVDVGGTKIAAGVVDEDGRILRVARTPTPAGHAADIADAIAALAREVAAGDDVGGVGIGAAGFVDADRSHVLFAPNLAWRDEPLRAEVAARLPWRVVVENDANAMAWAEYRFGAGHGADPLVAVTVGTGIGGGIVLGGRLYRGRFGVAAEPGHVRVVPDGHRCGCGNRGCWEQYCSGRALVREAREIASVRPEQARRLLELSGGDARVIDGPAVTAAARDGDPAAREAFAAVGTWLGQGLADLAAVLDPARFVIGGGVGEAGELLLEPARRRYAEVVIGRGYRQVADIVGAELGNEAGLVGAADLSRAGG